MNGSPPGEKIKLTKILFVAGELRISHILSPGPRHKLS